MTAFSRLLGGALICGCCALAPAAASAAILYSQAPVDDGTSYFSNAGALNQSADDLSVVADGSVRFLSWWGAWDDPQLAGGDAFALRIFDNPLANAVPIFACGDAFAVPPTPCAGITSTTTGLTDSAGRNVYKFALDLGKPLGLAGGASYFLSITNENPDTAWSWLQSAPGNGGLFRMEDSEDFLQEGPNLAFMLEDERQVIAEPGLLALLGLAGLGFGAVRRRRVGT